jgi:hypothetical protein
MVEIALIAGALGFSFGLSSWLYVRKLHGLILNKAEFLRMEIVRLETKLREGK